MTSQPDWLAAQAAYERGDGLRTIAATVATSYESVRRRAKKEGWAQPTSVAERRLAQTANATTVRTTRWRDRQEEEADAAGIYAGLARQAVRGALDAGDAQMTRAAAVAYGIFIDKAQLLSGGATIRTEHAGKEAAHAVADELAQRRSKGQAA